MMSSGALLVALQRLGRSLTCSVSAASLRHVRSSSSHGRIHPRQAGCGVDDDRGAVADAVTPAPPHQPHRLTVLLNQNRDLE